MFVFLNFETVCIGLCFLLRPLINKLIKLDRLFPLTGCIFVMPFNQVDNDKVTADNKKVTKAKGGQEKKGGKDRQTQDTDGVIDY